MILTVNKVLLLVLYVLSLAVSQHYTTAVWPGLTCCVCVGLRLVESVVSGMHTAFMNAASVKLGILSAIFVY